ncbi:MAG TPA: DUF4127 family protein, partial [Pyrinomonadaceae bacterium]|nr:DUF4127 family protein [Pyrinomonadaceae bacterium]
MKRHSDRNRNGVKTATAASSSDAKATLKKAVSVVAALLSLIAYDVTSTTARAAAGAQRLAHTYAARVLLIPLDDRPPCLQFPIMQGLIADAEVVAPPREMLGRFTVPGDAERIAAWVRAQDFTRFDRVIVSIDMLAYGGLVASRVHRTPRDEAMRRLDLLRDIRRRAPRLPVYA